MEKSDVGFVVDIEHTEPSAWSRRLIADEFDLDNSHLLVAAIDERVIGWCCARVIGDDAELLKIGVSGNYRRQSIGTMLMSALLKTLEKLEIKQLLLEVRSQNTVALDFYHRLGFTPVGRRINYYSEPADDALLLIKPL